MKDQFKSINILWLALLAGQLIFFTVIYFVMPGTGSSDLGIFETLVPIFLLGALTVGYYINKMRMNQGAELEGLEQKLEHYRATVIMRSALFEGANLMAVIAMFLDRPEPYLVYFAVGVAAFIFFRPSIEKFISGYQLKEQEAQELRSGLR